MKSVKRKVLAWHSQILPGIRRSRDGSKGLAKAVHRDSKFLSRIE